MNKEKITATTLVKRCQETEKKQKDEEKEAVLAYIRPVFIQKIKHENFRFPITIHCYDNIRKLINILGISTVLLYLNEFLVEYKDDTYELYAEYLERAGCNNIEINYRKLEK